MCHDIFLFRSESKMKISVSYCYEKFVQIKKMNFCNASIDIDSDLLLL